MHRRLDEVDQESLHGLDVRSLFSPEEADMLSFRWIRAEADTLVPPSFHKEACEVLYVLQGAARFRLDDDCFEVKAGDFLSIPPGVVHSMKTSSQGITFVAVQTPPVERNVDFYPAPNAPGVED